MAKIKLESKDDFNNFANEVQEALAELKQAFDELKKEVKAIKDASEKGKQEKDSFWS